LDEQKEEEFNFTLEKKSSAHTLVIVDFRLIQLRAGTSFTKCVVRGVYLTSHEKKKKERKGESRSAICYERAS